MRDESKNQLTVATYNIHLGGMDMNYDYRILADDILKSGAAVVGMQEVDSFTYRNKQQDLLKIMAELTGWNICFGPAQRFELQHYGNALISKFPIVSSDFEILPFFGGSYEETRSVLHAVIDTGDIWLNCYVTHTEQSRIRQQLTRIHGLAENHDPYIVMGDFNWQEFGLFDDIFSGTTKANHVENHLRTTYDGYMFDNMIFSKSVRGENIRTWDTGHSDHRMLLADVTVGKQQD